MNTRLVTGLALMMVTVLVCPEGHAQGITADDLGTLTHQMADRVRHLEQDVASDLGRTPAGAHLIQDTQELAQAVDEFHDAEHNTRDLDQLRQAYMGIESTWQHLQGRLSQASSPAVNRAAGRVEEVDDLIRQKLGINSSPPGFYGGPPAPSGIADCRRLAHALVSRAATLSMVVRDELGGNPAMTADAAALARAADQFHDSIDSNQSTQAAAAAFAPVDAIAGRMDGFFTSNPVSPRVQNAWQGFANVESLIHQNLGMDVPQPQLRISLNAPPGGGPSPIVGLADTLAGQVTDFVRVYGPTAGVVPNGRQMLAIAERLQVASVNFQQAAARGLAPNQLAYEFRDVDALWRQLVRRVDRIAKGRTGPNINQVHLIGQTCAQIHQVLGMPGYPPVVNLP